MFQPVDCKQIYANGKDFLYCCANYKYQSGRAPDADWKELLKAELKRLKIINWYNAVRIRSGLNTAYALQRTFDSESFVRRDGETFHSHKWSAYRDGKHMPVGKLIERVESTTPGTAQELELMLWDALDVRQRIGIRANSMFKKMNNEIQNAVFKKRVSKFEALVRRPSIKLMSNLICKNCDLDSLAALTILTREAIEEGKMKDAHFWASKTFMRLLMLGQELHHRGIACSIIHLYRNLIFVDVVWDDFCFIDSEADIAQACAHLAIMVFDTLKNQDATLTWEQRVVCMRKLLRGTLGLDAYLAMQPQWAPEREVDKARQASFEMQQRLRKWAWDTIYGFVPFSYFPPDEVFTGKKIED